MPGTPDNPISSQDIHNSERRARQWQAFQDALEKASDGDPEKRRKLVEKLCRLLKNDEMKDVL